MRICTFSFLLMISYHLAMGQAFQMDTIQYVGHSEDYYDLILLAEGYQEEDMDQFFHDAGNVQAVLGFNNAYQPMMDQLNIFAIRTPSVDKGISLIAEDPSPGDPIQESDIKDTYFGIYFRNSYRAYFLDDSIQLKAMHVASEHVPFYDVILIVTNDEIGSGRAAFTGVAVAVKPDDDLNLNSAYLVNHELAHSIGGLSDAYDLSRDEGFNKTTNGDPATIRWKDLLHLPDVRIDSLTPGVYIPNVDCMMNDYNDSYLCPVCEQRITEKMGDVSKHLPPPYRVLIEKLDTASRSLTYSWDEVPGATHYEVVLNSFNFDSLLVRKVQTNEVTYHLPDEYFFQIYYIQGVSTNYATPDIIIRAYNDEASSYFLRHQVISDVRSLPNPYPVDVPTLDEFVQTSPSSYRLSFTQDDYLEATLIRMNNEDGHTTDILTNKKSVEIRGLKPDKDYQFKYAAVYSRDIQFGNSSDFSAIRSLSEAPADFDADGFTDDVDCDDLNPDINPGATEIIGNGIDEDCDGKDLLDNDNDGFTDDVDCNDSDPEINPEAIEICDDIDNNCNGQTDEGLTFITYYTDLDMDGFGDQSTGQDFCNTPTNLVENGLDCDDTNPDIYPGAGEIANNGIDEDCNGSDWILSSVINDALASVIVFPNPGISGVYTLTGYKEGDRVLLYDNNGRATKMKLMENKFTIGIPGIYILRISRGEADRFIRIIKL